MNGIRFVALAIGLTACGPKVDPLLPMKAELAAARKAGPAAHPHAQFALAESTALTIVQQAIGLDREQAVPLGMGAAAKIKANLTNPKYTLRTSRKKEPHAQFDLDGRVSATVSSILGTARLADRLGFSGSIGGGIRFGFKGSDTGQVVQLLPVKGDRIKATITLAAEKGPLTNTFVNKQIDGLLRQTFAEPLLIGRIPADVPLRAAALRLLPATTPMAGLWLQAPKIDAAVPSATPKSGWTLTTSNEAVLQASRAAFARMNQHRTWKIEPRELAVHPTGFDAVVRVYKKSRGLKYRDYQIGGTIQLDDRLVVTPVSVVEIDKQGFGASLVGPFVKGQVRKRVMALAIDRPAAIEQPIGKRSITWTLQTIRVLDEGLAVDGAIGVHKP